jgi:predicted alpha/beta-fold hydrolase
MFTERPYAIRPRPSLHSHVQTLYAWARPRTFSQLPPPSQRFFDVASDARVLAHCHWQDHALDQRRSCCSHGLEGSSLVHYMGGMADKAWASGWNVVRLKSA